MTSSWFFLSTLNYDARSTTHQRKTYLVPSAHISEECWNKWQSDWVLPFFLWLKILVFFFLYLNKLQFWFYNFVFVNSASCINPLDTLASINMPISFYTYTITFFYCHFLIQIAKNLLKCGINPLNAKLNPICHLLALLGAYHILHVSRIRVNNTRIAVSHFK